MGVRIKSLIGSLVLTTASTVAIVSSVAVPIAATAQEQPAPVFRPREVIPDAINEAFYGSKDTFQNRNLGQSTESLIGVIGYPENLIARDGEKIHRLYRDLLNQQTSSDPILRTADLPNPYNTSVLLQPNVSDRVIGSEFVIEQPPQAQFPPLPQMIQPGLPQRY
ncbi:hypothetical protein [Myxacorys almedinensis]|uniref:Uncharacterized protein n=1 Tax=Myxacorys almedinensis A TaxID=2690445 RepID=A0A8J7Z3L9_9CYAN|nr:hypothetical protein [Myxacorys almedinensis]NDJ19379.1 hypothetical protein [Myxacorys almedinensis A]